VKDTDKVEVRMEHGMLIISQNCEPRHNSTLDVINVNKENMSAFLQALAKLVHAETISLPPEPAPAHVPGVKTKRQSKPGPVSARSAHLVQAQEAMRHAFDQSLLDEYANQMKMLAVGPGGPLIKL